MTDDIEGHKKQESCCVPARHQGQGADEKSYNAPTIILAGAIDEDDDEIVEIPAAKAYIGTDKPYLEIDEEAPLRRQMVKQFYMDSRAVSVARFASFIADTGYQTDAEKLGDSFVFSGFLTAEESGENAVAAAPWWHMVKGASWHKPAGPHSDYYALAHHPVTHISWADAQAFAEWAGGRLPSEAEWEHAARGGLADALFPWGDKLPNEIDFMPCNIWQGEFPHYNSAADGYSGTAPVSSFAPNGYGLYNMVGNVWEWTATSFKVRSLKKAVKTAHRGKQGFKIVKGGSFMCHDSYCFRYRIAARTSNSPDSSTSHQGFRLVYDKKPERKSRLAS